MDKLTKSFEKLPGRISRLKESVAFAVNPDHRHDEEHEKAEDRQRAEICASHRFGSFADVQPGNDVKWYIDGHDYFYAVAEILDNAKEVIMIADWWLTPELFLRRVPSEHDEMRLDRILLRKAEQGVKVLVLIYKEVTQSMSLSSAHTKHHLEDMHENIACIRHPDHLGGEMTMYWSHHEKIVIVDEAVACVGGLDLCFGRWDTHNFPLSDVHPTDFSRSLFPGQDYNNARVQDFQHVDQWVSNQQSRLDTARMPWHDVHLMLRGPAVMDVCQHFVERWNFLKHLKQRHDSRYPILAFPHVLAENEEPQPAILRHPHWEKFKEIGEAFTRHALPPNDEKGIDPHGGLGAKGAMKVQVLRSSADWSHGILTEHSIMNAYIQMIAEANHCIYIENQFFITNTSPDKPFVKNLIGKAITERILSAARAGKKFKVVVLIPAIPGFAGDLKGNAGTLAIMGATYFSICRGGDSIMECIEREGFNPHDYISFYNLRSYDRINSDPERLKAMEAKSGVSFYQAQAALGRVFLGPDALPEELEKNKEVTFALGIEGAETINLDVKKDKDKNAPPTVTIPLPQGYEEAWDIIRRFERGDEVREKIADSVAHYALKRTAGGSLLDEPWSGNEESERNAFVTEELYIHSKLLIVDDRRVLMGSANLNERSQLGDRDSEIAVVVEDTDMIQSSMNGEPYMASRFAATLRRRLWKEHLGLIEPQFCTSHTEEPVTPAMKPVGVPHIDETASEEDRLVMDPLAEDTERLWKGTADKNAAIFDEVFHVVPSTHVETWKEYSEWVPQAPIKAGHVASVDMPVQHIKEQLDQVRGHLVSMPLNFLAKETLFERGLEVNVATINVYL
ncbi:phospholipase D/nuclease [Leucosporidium creatinivorum]|uniref:Phospholipase n=1 Tax=Leucosporidium creatinivorum TaxID=106004 RepID=A0A1Y2ENE9_9BASI|nr:phospholipase D/nuclease [Leucosporidium creatinivorum]